MAKEKRPYRSALREQQAAETRKRIVDAAITLFSERGYAGTTLARIAEKAGVSPETVQAHGPKAALLRAAIEVSAWGVDGLDDSMIGLEPVQAAIAAGPDGYPEGIAAFLRAGHEAGAGVFGALAGGAENDPVLRAALMDLVNYIRRQWIEGFDALNELGWIRPVENREQWVDTWCLIAGPEAYLRLVRDLGWTNDDYETWLASTLRALWWAD
jgi:AcrR family transcriptional regulator